MSEIVRIRASSWADLFDCAYRWEAKELLGMRMPTNFPAHLGTSLHKSTAAFDQGRIEKAGVTADDVAGVFVDSLHQGLADIDRRDNDLTVAEAEQIGLNLHKKYCNEVSPRFNYRAVELTAQPLDIDCDEVTVRITGTMDRTRIRAAKQSKKKGIAINDVKTGKRAANNKGRADTKAHQLQLGVYELLAEYSLSEVINGPATIIGLQTTKKSNIGISEIHNAQRTLVGTPEQPGLIQMAATMLKTGTFPPNPRSMLCHPRYCPRWQTCIFHD